MKNKNEKTLTFIPDDKFFVPVKMLKDVESFFFHWWKVFVRV